MFQEKLIPSCTLNSAFFILFFFLLGEQFLACPPPFPFSRRSEPESIITHNDGGHFDACLTDDAQLAAVKEHNLGKMHRLSDFITMH